MGLIFGKFITFMQCKRGTFVQDLFTTECDVKVALPNVTSAAIERAFNERGLTNAT